MVFSIPEIVLQIKSCNGNELIHMPGIFALNECVRHDL